jgi:hypothetical protein
MSKMIKHIPTDVVKSFIKAEAKFCEARDEFDTAKTEVRQYVAKGYTHPLLQIIEREVSTPNWKKLCLELIKKFMDPKQRKIWLRSVKKRFPAHAVAPTIRPAEKVGA